MKRMIFTIKKICKLNCFLIIILLIGSVIFVPENTYANTASEKYYNMHLENKFKKGAYFSQVFDKPVDQVTDFKDLDFIIYAFAEPTDTGYINPLKKENQAKDLITKAHANGVACFISFGGKYSYYDFCEIGKDENKTNFFTENVVDLCKKYGFDGVDIDWESPIPSDTESCNRLFKSLSTACKENKLYFTAALPGTYSPTEAVAELAGGFSDQALSRLDWVHLMTYSMEKLNSPLEFSENSINYWNKVRKIPKNKIILGVPFMAMPSYKNYDWIVAQDIKYALLNKAPGTKDYPLESNYDGYNRIYEKTKIALRDAGGIFSWTINMDSQTKYNLTKRIGDTVRDAQKIGLNRFTKQISIFLDNNLLNYNINTGYPYYDANNRTLVPIRATAEAAGLKVTWNQETLTATAEKNGTVIKIPLNKNQITINGETKTIDTNAVSYNGRIYIPIRAAFEGLGYKNITWNRISNTIYVDNDMTGESK